MLSGLKIDWGRWVRRSWFSYWGFFWKNWWECCPTLCWMRVARRCPWSYWFRTCWVSRESSQSKNKWDLWTRQSRRIVLCAGRVRLDLEVSFSGNRLVIVSFCHWNATLHLRAGCWRQGDVFRDCSSIFALPATEQYTSSLPSRPAVYPISPLEYNMTFSIFNPITTILPLQNIWTMNRTSKLP